jgi:Ca-activated chloride channel family protein
LIDSDAKSKIIILLTDGENTKGKISPLTAADIAASDSVNIKVYTICFGKKTGEIWAEGKHFNGEKRSGYVNAFFDEKTLEQIANKTGGEYFRATDNESLEGIYNTINKLETSEIENIKFNNKTEEFYLFSLIALGLFLLSFTLKTTYFRGIN